MLELLPHRMHAVLCNEFPSGLDALLVLLNTLTRVARGHTDVRTRLAGSIVRVRVSESPLFQHGIIKPNHV